MLWMISSTPEHCQPIWIRSLCPYQPIVLAYLFVVRPVQKQALSRNELTTALQPALVSGNSQSLTAGQSFSADNAQRAAQLKMQAFELVRQKPLDTARAMQAWMREEKE